jgi:hypothetical protein
MTDADQPQRQLPCHGDGAKPMSQPWPHMKKGPRPKILTCVKLSLRVDLQRDTSRCFRFLLAVFCCGQVSGFPNRIQMSINVPKCAKVRGK